MISNLNPKKRKKKKKRRNPTRPFGKFRVAPPVPPRAPSPPQAPPFRQFLVLCGRRRAHRNHHFFYQFYHITTYHPQSDWVGGFVCLDGAWSVITVTDSQAFLRSALCTCACPARPLRYGTGDQSTTLLCIYSTE